MQSTEKWLPVVGYEGLYEVSSAGLVRSLDRIDALGRLRPGVPMSPQAGRNLYLRVPLSKSGTKTKLLIHRIVLEAFAGPSFPGAEACHNDGNRQNNKFENLRWDTRSANRLDSVTHGTHRSARKVTCERGHQLVAPNLTAASVKVGQRACRACGQAWGHAQAHHQAFDQVVADEKFARIMSAA